MAWETGTPLSKRRNVLGCTYRSVCGAPSRSDEASQSTVSREQLCSKSGGTGNLYSKKPRVSPYAAPALFACSLVELRRFHSDLLQLCSSKRSTVRELICCQAGCPPSTKN